MEEKLTNSNIKAPNIMNFQDINKINKFENLYVSLTVSEEYFYCKTIKILFVPRYSPVNI